jgi:hypothetical protein
MAPAPRSRFRLPAIPPKYLSSILITVVLVVGQIVGDIVGGYDRLLLALGTAVAAELLLSRLMRGKWPVLLSAYISGNSVAILTKPAGGLLWPFWMGSLIAITSKYALTYRNRHLWNPTNFSISALLLLSPGRPWCAWWTAAAASAARTNGGCTSGSVPPPRSTTSSCAGPRVERRNSEASGSTACTS